MDSIEDHEDLLIIKPSAVQGSKFEARCHLCSWSYHRWIEDDARVILRTHIIDAHLTPIKDREVLPPDRRIS